MARVFVDMDGVLVDFDGFMAKHNLTPDETKKMHGAYLAMDPYPDGLAGIRELIAMGFEVWIATKPPTGLPFAYADKVAWILEHLPELSERIILTHDKGLLGNPQDFLIDDRPHKANCEQFAGTLIRFHDGKTWAQVAEQLRAFAPRSL